MSMYNAVNAYIKKSLNNKDIAYSHLTGNGATTELEAKLCSSYGAKHALCVDSATNGLMYLLLAIGLQRCEILTTPLSFGGTIAGAMYLGCKFHFADIDQNLNIDPKSVEKILYENRKIKCVLAVDFAGNPHNMNDLYDICDRYGVWHFTDAAQSMGCVCSNAPKLNDAIVVSFGSGKTVFAGGEGGAIMTNNTELYNMLLLICQHPHRQEHDLGIGYSNEFSLNGRIHPIAAILANESLEKGIELAKVKRAIYLNALRTISTFESVEYIPEQHNSAFYHCPIVVNNPNLFDIEFKKAFLSDDFYYSKAPFVLLPAQLTRIRKNRIIKSFHCKNAENLLSKLYLLHLLK